MMQFVSHTAPRLSCVDVAGNARSIADRIAFGRCIADPAIRARAGDIDNRAEVSGRVYSRGAWRDPAVHAQLTVALGATFASALRPDFEWYCCRGAFFHNDAHYDARLFGTWCIAGPAAELVFPRASVRLPSTPGSIAVFDPFEVHGILLPNAELFSAADYDAIEATVTLGFELDLTPEIAAALGIASAVTGRVISSRTRIAATSGAVEFL